MQLIAKLFIKGTIELVTGLTIGTSKTDVAIGGIDNSVVKTSQGIPYIPGSSLKGKMRSLLERTELDRIKLNLIINELDKKKVSTTIIEKNRTNPSTLNQKEKASLEDAKKEVRKKDHICNCGKCDICAIFGTSADQDEKAMVGPNRLYVRDAFLSKETIDAMESGDERFADLELKYTEGKWENKINRITSTTSSGSLRQTERVPAGAEFIFNMVYNIYTDIDIQEDQPALSKKDFERFKKVIAAMEWLEDDYLGGSGSRGYGRIKFKNLEITIKDKAVYEGTKKADNTNKFDYIQNLKKFINQDGNEQQKIFSSFYKSNTSKEA